jgi:hypothetical protein
MSIKSRTVKIISAALVVTLMNLTGCYSYNSVTLREYKKIEEKKGKPETIYVLQGSNEEYHFSNMGYKIENDTLYGRGLKVVNHEKQPFEGKIPLAEITSIRLSEFDSGTTVLAILGIILTVSLVYIVSAWSSWGSKK